MSLQASCIPIRRRLKKKGVDPHTYRLPVAPICRRLPPGGGTRKRCVVEELRTYSECTYDRSYTENIHISALRVDRHADMLALVDDTAPTWGANVLNKTRVAPYHHAYHKPYLAGQTCLQQPRLYRSHLANISICQISDRARSLLYVRLDVLL